MTKVTTNGVRHGRADGDELLAELVEAAAGDDRPSVPTRVDREGDAEDAGREGAPGAADAVHADHVQRVVQADLGAQPDGEVAERAGADADGESAHRLDEAGGRRNRDQAGDGAGSRADDAGLAAA